MIRTSFCHRTRVVRHGVDEGRDIVRKGVGVSEFTARDRNYCRGQRIGTATVSIGVGCVPVGDVSELCTGRHTTALELKPYIYLQNSFTLFPRKRDMNISF